ncbi:MAG TPA: succinate--CoA ligase subunit alpha, partial [Actinomycetota bacterium]|nr:succinate--CoA ligase subunit alpha [Actinomycetota bacterium]
MAVIVDSDTRLVVQGLTGSEGSFHAGRNKDYGTNLVAGVTPGKGGTEHLGVPIFDTVAEAVKATDANTSMVFVPARFAADAILESFDAGIPTIVAITEHIPAMDMARVVAYLRGDERATLIGPNCPGVISPGQANVGIIPGEICSPGPVGLVSRSGTLVYQIVHELTQLGIGQSTCVGIGGDPIPGSDFIDVLTKFRDDPATEIVVLVGEIGGDAEERAAAWAKANLGKPLVGYFAGR